MSNEWKVLTRVIEQNSDFKFTDEGYDRYISTVSEVYADAISENNGTPEYPEAYNAFLLESVLSDERIIKVLQEEDVPESQISAILDGTIDLDEAVKTWNEIRFTIDELIDLLMLLKLIRDYSSESSSKRIESRFRLQKLAYLVNQNLMTQQDYSIRDSQFGLLSKTGFRYQYTNRNSGPFSEQVYQDKNRLFAWTLLDEPIVEDEGTGEVAENQRRYAIELSAQGEILVERFYNRIENTDSFIISEWNRAQKEEIEIIAEMSQSELEDYINEKSGVQVTPTGHELLIGPENKFQENDIEYLDELRGEFIDA